jgi:hypothetical protein
VTAFQTLLRAPPPPAAADPWVTEIPALIADESFVVPLVFKGRSHRFVIERDLKHALGATGADGARRIRAVMKELGWLGRPARVNGVRVRGFASP